MAWIFLVIGGLMEVGWALGLKYSDGFSNPIISLLTVVGIGVSFFFFGKAIKYLPIGTAYAIFTGLGAAGTTIVGMVYLNESVSIFKLLFVLLLIFSIVGLKLTSAEEA
ncbi:DMT family transporter [Guptibacillus algicola]|uniref:DMT family transporter n=1 Tax=Guptibacillus algicola TaxID=225844 RepID=UPI001CD29FCB|nr:multidrug efflux SMR transporter [Alkalihalobacillus algicola]MCA0988740.1 multidrug efflux SMR transporter [Alkalihalobacillus algicola]